MRISRLGGRGYPAILRDSRCSQREEGLEGLEGLEGRPPGCPALRGVFSGKGERPRRNWALQRKEWRFGEAPYKAGNWG